MAINPTGTGIPALAAQMISSQSGQMENEKNIALLADSMDIQKEMISGILKSLGKGQNIDIVV
jgi:hypothetical protein